MNDKETIKILRNRIKEIEWENSILWKFKEFHISQEMAMRKFHKMLDETKPHE